MNKRFNLTSEKRILLAAVSSISGVIALLSFLVLTTIIVTLISGLDTFSYLEIFGDQILLFIIVETVPLIFSVGSLVFALLTTKKEKGIFFILSISCFILLIISIVLLFIL